MSDGIYLPKKPERDFIRMMDIDSLLDIVPTSFSSAMTSEEIANVYFRRFSLDKSPNYRILSLELIDDLRRLKDSSLIFCKRRINGEGFPIYFWWKNETDNSIAEPISSRFGLKILSYPSGNC